MHQSDAAAGGHEVVSNVRRRSLATEKTYDSDELDETSHLISSAVASADDVFAETDAAGKKMPSSQPLTRILPADTPETAALKMARRPSENGGSDDDGAAHIVSADDAKQSAAGSDKFKRDQAERTRAADMDDEDF